MGRYLKYQQDAGLCLIRLLINDRSGFRIATKFNLGAMGGDGFRVSIAVMDYSFMIMRWMTKSDTGKEAGW